MCGGSMRDRMCSGYTPKAGDATRPVVSTASGLGCVPCRHEANIARGGGRRSLGWSASCMRSAETGGLLGGRAATEQNVVQNLSHETFLHSIAAHKKRVKPDAVCLRSRSMSMNGCKRYDPAR